MPVISLAIQKGNSGKMTTALQHMGRNVLHLDTALQANLKHSLAPTNDVGRGKLSLRSAGVFERSMVRGHLHAKVLLIQ